MPHGRCFVVINPDRLVAEVLPRYFNQTKILSFVRQLNLWGFKRLTRGLSGKAYYHELFLRARPYLALRLKRESVKGHDYKPIPNPSCEPNFFSYLPVDSLARTSVPTSEANDQLPVKGRGPRSKKRIMIDRADAVDNKESPGNVASKSEPNVMQAAAKKTSPKLMELRGDKPLGLVNTQETTLDGETVAPQPAAAAPAADRLAGLLAAGDLQFAGFSGMFGDRLLAERLAQLQREEAQLEMLRMMSSNKMAATFRWQAPACSMPEAAQTAGCGDSMPESVSESLREAQYLEQLALAARERAQKAVMEAQSRYGMGK
jgi:hypothetical protein